MLNLLKRNANLVIRNLPKEAFKLNDVIELQKNLELIQKMIKKLKKSNSKWILNTFRVIVLILVLKQRLKKI